MFLGETDAARVDGLIDVLADVARRHEPYETRVNGAGGHVDDRPGARRGGVAWLTLDAGFSQTADLSLDVDASIEARTYDARRRPRPHLTVARAVDADALSALRDHALTLRLAWLTSSLVLFRSVLGQGGSRYEPLATLALAEAS